MALLKEKINHSTGVVSTYHRVGSVEVRDSELSCQVASYVSKDYRSQGRSVERSHYQFEITLEEEESMGVRQLAYTKLKTLPEWEGAEDC